MAACWCVCSCVRVWLSLLLLPCVVLLTLQRRNDNGGSSFFLCSPSSLLADASFKSSHASLCVSVCSYMCVCASPCLHAALGDFLWTRGGREGEQRSGCEQCHNINCCACDCPHILLHAYTLACIQTHVVPGAISPMDNNKEEQSSWRGGGMADGFARLSTHTHTHAA